MQLKPWRQIAVPHVDVREGKFQQAEFAADLSRVHERTATEEYQNAELFFQRTFITEGMRLLLDSVVRRVGGRGGDPVIQLQTAFGGGKTHTMLAVYHLVSGGARASDLHGVSPILDAAGVIELPQARVAVLDGNKSAPNQPLKRGNLSICTLWGDLAWQLGGAEGYAMVAEADASGTSPGKAVLQELLNRFGPCVILMDELVAYIRQFEDGKTLSGGTFDSNLSFLQALTEALKGAPTSVLLASLPESEKEAGSSRGIRALAAVEHHFGRVQALWKPVATEESFEIVRRRLFSNVGDKAAMSDVCRAFANHYIEHRDEFPHETQQGDYLRRLEQAYPIHPEVFDRLYEDWSTLETFQRTRGVLKLMATVIHSLWKDGNDDPLILPGSLPLANSATRNEALAYLPQGWDPVIERDVDGPRSEPWQIESSDPRLGSLQACRRTARTIFLGSAPNTKTSQRGIEVERILLGVARPDHNLSVYKDALTRLKDRLHHLNTSNDRYWLDTRPNLRREMEDRKRRFDEREHLIPFIQKELQRVYTSPVFNGVHVFTKSSDVPDDGGLRLVILPPTQAYASVGAKRAQEAADELLKKRGEQPRFRQNRLLFVAAESDSVSRLYENIRSFLAWQSIINDYGSNTITLDNLMAKNAEENLQQAQSTMRQVLREVYKWLLVPAQFAEPGRGVAAMTWEAYALNTGSRSFGQEVERVLREEELVIFEWAPIHLQRTLSQWFWKDDGEALAQQVWQQMTQHLYLPRLKDEAVYRQTLTKGASSTDFFGFAQGKEGARYLGFSYGQAHAPSLDGSLLLLSPQRASAYADQLRAAAESARAAAEASAAAQAATPSASSALPHAKLHDIFDVGASDSSARTAYTQSAPADVEAGAVGPTKFFGTVELNSHAAVNKFETLYNEVLEHLNDVGMTLTITVDIRADSPEPYSDEVQRIVKENAHALRFKNADFEE